MTDSETIPFPRTHRIAAVCVLIECSCGDSFEAETEPAAIRDWEIHCDDEEKL